MRLGMHTYSLYHHGVAEDWAGFHLPWPRQMDIRQMMDYMVELGLEGLHLDDKAFESFQGQQNHHKTLWLQIDRCGRGSRRS